MTGDEVRKHWLETRRALLEVADQIRNTMVIPIGLLDAYDRLTAEEKPHIHPILAEWIVSDDSGLRYDAGFLASRGRIVELIPAIRTAICRLATVPGAEAKYDSQNLTRKLNELCQYANGADAPDRE